MRLKRRRSRWRVDDPPYVAKARGDDSGPRLIRHGAGLDKACPCSEPSRSSVVRVDVRLELAEAIDLSSAFAKQRQSARRVPTVAESGIDPIGNVGAVRRQEADFTSAHQAPRRLTNRIREHRTTGGPSVDPSRDRRPRLLQRGTLRRVEAA